MCKKRLCFPSNRRLTVCVVGIGCFPKLRIMPLNNFGISATLSFLDENVTFKNCTFKDNEGLILGRHVYMKMGYCRINLVNSTFIQTHFNDGFSKCQASPNLKWVFSAFCECWPGRHYKLLLYGKYQRTIYTTLCSYKNQFDESRCYLNPSMPVSEAGQTG